MSVDLQPVSCALDPLVAPRTGDVRTRCENRLFREVRVAVAPERQGRDTDGRESRPLERLARVAVCPIPVERRGQRSRSRELGHETITIDSLVEPVPEKLPVVAAEEPLGHARELEEQLVPPLPPLLE